MLECMEEKLFAELRVCLRLSPQDV